MHRSVGSIIYPKIAEDGLGVTFAIGVNMLRLHGEIVAADSTAALAAEVYGLRFWIGLTILSGGQPVQYCINVEWEVRLRGWDHHNSRSYACQQAPRCP